VFWWKNEMHADRPFCFSKNTTNHFAFQNSEHLGKDEIALLKTQPPNNSNNNNTPQKISDKFLGKWFVVCDCLISFLFGFFYDG